MWCTCSCRRSFGDCFVILLPAPAPPTPYLPGLVCHVLFQSGQKAFESGVFFYFEMSSKGLTLQDPHLIFQPAALLQQNTVGRQSAGHPGTVPVVNFVDDLLYKAFEPDRAPQWQKLKSQTVIHCFLHIFLNLWLRCLWSLEIVATYSCWFPVLHKRLMGSAVPRTSSRPWSPPP